MNNKLKDIKLKWMSKNSPLTQDKIEPDQNIGPSVAGIEPKTVKMVRPFAEAEARERERVREKQEARAKAEEEAKIKAEAELQPKTVKMVAPFAEAEEREREAREKAKIKAEQEAKIKAEQKKVTATGSNKTNVNVSPPATPEKAIIIPDQLNITIRTSVPGFQKIEYKPSMTIKDIDSKGVLFNPLIKLNKSVVDKIPTEYRTKQFFNKGLFQSLINYNRGSQAKGLLQATRSGYIDNNIKVTLGAIFPVNSVIYIGKQPYAIGDIQWTTGDWNIEVKQKKVEIDPSKVTDPRLYTQLIQEEIISGEEQLNQIPQALVVGNNYSGPPIAKSANIIPLNDQFQQTVSTQSTIKPVTNEITSSKELTISNQTKPINQPITTKTISESVPYLIEDSSNVNQNMIENYSNDNQQLIENVEKPVLTLPESEKIEELSPEEEKLFESLKGKFEINLRDTKEFSNYFMQNVYYSVANNIYLNLPGPVQEQMTNFYKLVTQPKIVKEGKNLSKTMYTELCKQVKIIKSPSDGNCFFASVANGLNIYNYNNQDSKIYYQNYGKTQLFTTSIIREIVLRYYELLDEDQKKDIKIIGLSNVASLNDKFKQSINDLPPTSNIEYMERVNDIYANNDNFFVNKPDARPIIIDEDESPFKLVTDGQISNYIRSNYYWGDQFAIQAICNILKIYIVPIEKIYYGRSYKFITRITEPDMVKNMCSRTVLFLQKKKMHYDLIRFEYLQQKIQKTDVNSKILTIAKKYTIFKYDGLPPPFHILILIYGSNYILTNSTIKNNYGLYKKLMEFINYSVAKIVNNEPEKSSILFSKSIGVLFNLKYPLSNYIKTQHISKNLIEQGNKRLDRDSSLSTIDGGAPPQYGYPQYRQYDYPQYRQYSYPQYRQYDSRTITKKPEDQSASKIAYSITIDMELHPGTSLSPEQLKESKCNSKYNAIRKAFSEFIGRPYVISPIYKNSKTAKREEKKLNTTIKNRNS